MATKGRGDCGEIDWHKGRRGTSKAMAIAVGLPGARMGGGTSNAMTIAEGMPGTRADGGIKAMTIAAGLPGARVGEGP